jgi:iron complex outermembrane receptor protein
MRHLRTGGGNRFSVLLSSGAARIAPRASFILSFTFIHLSHIFLSASKVRLITFRNHFIDQLKSEMKFFLTGIIVCACFCAAKAQHNFSAVIVNANTNEPLAGATVFAKQQQITAVSDSSGKVIIAGIAPGKQVFVVSYVGFIEKTVACNFPPDQNDLVIKLDPHEEDEEEQVVVTATRTSRSIANIPTRTEVISGEELMEKANMKPGDIRMLLNESTGIQTQQTSATSFNSGIRIQGLDGRYTQILRDGYPLYAGFAGGLSLLQIAPLDLKQVEVIKGSASTLYGGGAIAGLVNLVSKTPGNERQLNFFANGTTAGGLDLSGFYSERYKNAGVTVFASGNRGAPYDPADIGLTAIPKFERYTINPRVFYYSKKTTADVGISFITEDRVGGSMKYIKEGTAGFFEQNNTDRITTQLGITHQLNKKSALHLKGSYSHFNRLLSIPTYRFDALQQSSFFEISYNRDGKRDTWVGGVNLLTDDLQEKQLTTDPARDYHYTTFGAFVQNTWTIGKELALEAGLRADYLRQFGLEWLPRVSAMYRLSPKLTTRLGGGFGYKSPTIFTEDAERKYFRHILPVDARVTRNERSIGGNWDINYRTTIGNVSVTLNQLFFYTRLNRPLVMMPGFGDDISFVNSTGHLDTEGMETNVRLIYHDFKLFLGYTYTDANTHFATKEWMPLTARHRLNNVLMYEKEDKWKIGAEAYYFSRQQLSDGSFGKPYWIAGLMIEKIWRQLSVFVNFENITDTRQTRFGTIFTGSIDDPLFRDIYAPLDGFVANAGIKLKL